MSERPRPGTGKVYMATVLLILGVALIGASAETGSWWFVIPGYSCLMFVPTLVFEASIAGSREVDSDE